MDWIKVKVKHGEYEFADAPDNVFRTWIMMMLFIAATEKIPSEIQLEARLGKDNYQALCSHLSRNGVTVRHITDKVMEDVNMIIHKRQKGKERQAKYRQDHAQGNVLRNKLVTEADKIRGDKIRGDIDIRFETFCKDYPRPVNIAIAYQVFKSSVKTEEDFKALTVALKNYKSSDDVKKNFIKNADNWLMEWKEWIKVTIKPKTRITA